MAYLPSMHRCCNCDRYLGPDNGDGICSGCELHICPDCGEWRADEVMEDGEVCRNCKDRVEDV